MKLQDELDAIKDDAHRGLPAEVTSSINGANAALAASGLVQRALRAGQRMPDFELPGATGSTVKSVDLRARGPLVVSFYRGHWCPYCNLELRALQRLLPEFAIRKATLVAISPQTPDQSLTTQEKHSLEFPVLSDTGNAVARQFGLVFAVDPSLRPIYEQLGVDLSMYNGDETFELPVPATYVVASSGEIVGAAVDVDYSRRAEPAAVLAWVDRAIES